jgi:hypothetical protein
MKKMKQEEQSKSVCANHGMRVCVPSSQMRLSRVMWKADEFIRKAVGGTSALAVYERAYPWMAVSQHAWMSSACLQCIWGDDPVNVERWNSIDVARLMRELEAAGLGRFVTELQRVMHRRIMLFEGMYWWRLASWR